MQPMSLQRADLETIRSRKGDYVVCEKTDGERYLLYIEGERAYFIDRKGDVQVGTLNASMPMPRTRLENNEAQITLLDGERIGDMFLVFDALVVVGRDVCGFPLTERLSYALDVVRANPTKPLNMSMKDFFRISDMDFLWTKAMPLLPHESDGLIFTPIHVPYSPGKCEALFKWKPETYNTIDFLCEPMHSNGRNRTRLSLYNNHQHEPFGWLSSETEDGPVYEGVYECKWDPSAESSEQSTARGGWVIFRPRPDKDKANCVATAEHLFETIKDPLNYEGVRKVLLT